MKKKLPRGVQSFESLITKNCYYVDKTEQILNMLEGDECYFLARPRRFGKTLLIKTMRSLFEGRKDLFKDTYIYDKWDFKQNTCPVIVLDFVGGEYDTQEGLRNKIRSQLYLLEKDHGINDGEKIATLFDRFFNIIKTLSKKHSDVVILVDEFDKPILDAIENKELSEYNRKILAGIYGTIKGCNEFLRFVFVTGITFFPKDDISSGMNHFTDISLKSKFSTICGYTEEELNKVFAPELENVDIEEIRENYNGYSWDGKTSVYNPYAILNYFEEKEVEAWWYDTSNSKSLFNLIKKKKLYLAGAGKCWAKKTDLTNLNLDEIQINSLLFQMGVFTIKDQKRTSDRVNRMYYLDFPNKEVKHSFADHLYNSYIAETRYEVLNHGRTFLGLLRLGKFEQVITPLHSLYAMFPSANVDAANLEFWYGSSLMYSLLGNDCKVSTEVSSNKGRADIVLEDQGYVFVFELKVIDSNKTNQQASIEKAKKNAFEQIKNRGYLDKYSSVKNTIYGAALIIDKKQKNVVSLTFKQKHELDKDSK